METGFASAVAEWNDFFGAVAGAAATLIGLLFVALALSPTTMGEKGPAGLRALSEQSFLSFLSVLVIALVALIPDATPQGLAITLLIVGIQGAWRVVGDLRRARADPDPDWRGRQALSNRAVPAVASAICLWAATEAWRGDDDALSWLGVVIFLLVFSAAASCWDLLKAIGDRQRVEAPDGTPGDRSAPNV